VLKADTSTATASGAMAGMDHEALVKLITAQVVKQLTESQSASAK
jgi:hypothetical protein